MIVNASTALCRTGRRGSANSTRLAFAQGMELRKDFIFSVALSEMAG
jgi:hypothetical protein